MHTDTLLVELGTEELPPKALKSLGLAFRDGIVAGLAQRDLAHGEVQWFATPRRLAVLILEVQRQAPEKIVEVLGPPLDRARDDAGNWTSATVGFAKKQGVEPELLQSIDTPKGPRLGLRHVAPGVTSRDVLNAVVSASVQDLPIPRRMRWGGSREEFVRPVHWVVAMLGRDCDHGNILGLATGNTTRGHRFLGNEVITLERPERYVEALADAHVVASFEQRRQMIVEQVQAQANALGATAVIAPDLLDEVTGLVEWPVALTGSFEEQVSPGAAGSAGVLDEGAPEVFHVVDNAGRLKPHFIAVATL
ncbi:MAG: glycine--tRNA ligase subunit beta [Halioglobus sp.]